MRVGYPVRMSAPARTFSPHDLAALAAEGMLITLAAGHAGSPPALATALALRLGDQPAEVTVLLPRSGAWQLLADLAGGAAWAVSLSHPRTHRAIQLKGRRAEEILPAATDVALVARQRENLRLMLAAAGFDDAMLATLCAFDPDDLTAIALTLDTAYDQTPGAQTGQALERAA